MQSTLFRKGNFYSIFYILYLSGVTHLCLLIENKLNVKDVINT